jgi:hypothetical protein
MPKYTAAEPQSGGASHVAPGNYKIEVIKAVEKTSAAGNDMIVLDCQIQPNGPTVREHLVFTAKAGWKIDQVRAACGQAVVPGEDTVVTAESFDGATAIVEIGEEAGKNNPDQTFNCIVGWILPADAKGLKLGASGAPAKASKPAEKDAHDFAHAIAGRLLDLPDKIDDYILHNDLDKDWLTQALRVARMN